MPCRLFVLCSLTTLSHCFQPCHASLTNVCGRSSSSLARLHRPAHRARLCVPAEPPPPPWVAKVNAALEDGAVSYACAFILLDMGTALALCVLLLVMRVSVAAEFALAFTIAKSPALRGPRLGVDAAAAAALSRAFPPLAAVRVSLLGDAMARFFSLFKRANFGRPARTSRVRGADAVEVHGRQHCPAGSPDRPLRNSDAVTATRRLTDAYGLSYLVAKNFLGPMTIFLTYAVLIACGGSGESAALRRTAEWVARLALGPGAHSFDGVRLPSVGQAAGCVCLASTLSSLAFPIVVIGAAKLAPALTAMMSPARSPTAATQVQQAPGGDGDATAAAAAARADARAEAEQALFGGGPHIPGFGSLGAGAD